MPYTFVTLPEFSTIVTEKDAKRVVDGGLVDFLNTLDFVGEHRTNKGYFVKVASTLIRVLNLGAYVDKGPYIEKMLEFQYVMTDDYEQRLLLCLIGHLCSVGIFVEIRDSLMDKWAENENHGRFGYTDYISMYIACCNITTCCSCKFASYERKVRWFSHIVKGDAIFDVILTFYTELKNDRRPELIYPCDNEVTYSTCDVVEQSIIHQGVAVTNDDKAAIRFGKIPDKMGFLEEKVGVHCRRHFPHVTNYRELLLNILKQDIYCL